MAKTSRHEPSGPKSTHKAATPEHLTMPCKTLKQGKHTMHLFPMSAKKLWSVVQINQRQEDKEEGYQRALSISRVNKIAKYLDDGNAIPGAILISFDKAKLSSDGTKLVIDNKENAGWVIDGQHRLAGAHKATADVEVPVVALLGLSTVEQIKYFVTINREQQGVASSLYYDLLKHLPGTKTEAEVIQERAADLADKIRKDAESPFYQRIVVTTSPRQGQLSLTNVIRKLSPHLKRDGRLAQFNDEERAAILVNLYQGLEQAFPREYQRPDSVFFRTIGFGAIMNALPVIIDSTFLLANRVTFRVDAVVKTLRLLGTFNFDAWRQMGTGTAAENQAADDIRTRIAEEAAAVTKTGIEL